MSNFWHVISATFVLSCLLWRGRSERCEGASFNIIRIAEKYRSSEAIQWKGMREPVRLLPIFQVDRNQMAKFDGPSLLEHRILDGHVPVLFAVKGVRTVVNSSSLLSLCPVQNRVHPLWHPFLVMNPIQGFLPFSFHFSYPFLSGSHGKIFCVSWALTPSINWQSSPSPPSVLLPLPCSTRTAVCPFGGLLICFNFLDAAVFSWKQLLKRLLSSTKLAAFCYRLWVYCSATASNLETDRISGVALLQIPVLEFYLSAPLKRPCFFNNWTTKKRFMLPCVVYERGLWLLPAAVSNAVTCSDFIWKGWEAHREGLMYFVIPNASKNTGPRQDGAQFVGTHSRSQCLYSWYQLITQPTQAYPRICWHWRSEIPKSVGKKLQRIPCTLWMLNKHGLGCSPGIHIKMHSQQHECGRILVLMW